MTKTENSLPTISPDTPIHLWINTSEVLASVEQWRFIAEAFQQAGFNHLSISRHFAPHALNLVLEFFPDYSRKKIAYYCNKYQKKIAVIMTEHIDVIDDEIFFYGLSLNNEHDERFTQYMSSKQSVEDRLQGIIDVVPYTAFYCRLGHLPRLQNFTKIVGEKPVVTIPYPKLKIQDRSLAILQDTPLYDFCKIGYMSDWRLQQLAALRGKGNSVLSSRRKLTGRRRDGCFSHSKIVLNIPQWSNWNWLSPMRVLSAFRTKRPCLNIFDAAFDGGGAENFSIAMSSEELLNGKADAILEDWEGYFKNSLIAYENYIASSANPPFPYQIFCEWVEQEKHNLSIK